MNHFTITSVLRSLLLQDEKIKAFVNERIFPLQAPLNTDGDFILYQRDGYATYETKMGIFQKEPLVFFNIVSEDYDRSQELAGLVHDCLVGHYDQMHISLEDSTEDITDKKFIQVLLLKIKL